MKPGYINLRVMRVDQVTQPYTKRYDRLSDEQGVSRHCIRYEGATQYVMPVKVKVKVPRNRPEGLEGEYSSTLS
jgi:hypothetical protein